MLRQSLLAVGGFTLGLSPVYLVNDIEVLMKQKKLCQIKSFVRIWTFQRPKVLALLMALKVSSSFAAAAMLQGDPHGNLLK